MEFIHTHLKDVLAIIGATVTLASLIVKLTPTQKDDSILAGIIKVLSALGVFNPDGSLVGKKEDQK